MNRRIQDRDSAQLEEDFASWKLTLKHMVVPGLGRPFVVSHQAGLEVNLAIAKKNPKLHASGEQFLFHLAGHAGLLSATVSRSVGIRINRIRTELIRRATEPKTIPNPVVQPTQLFLNGVGGMLGILHTLACRDQQFGDHVPVRAANAFIAVHAT